MASHEQGQGGNAPERAVSTSAQQRVFGVNELLQEILLQLPWKDLFISQSVCRQFRDVVAGSTRLQQKMFLLPRNQATHPRSEGPDICPALQRHPNRRWKGPSRHQTQEQEVICYIAPPAHLTSERSWWRLHLTSPSLKMSATFTWADSEDDDALLTIHHIKDMELPQGQDGFTIGEMFQAAVRDEQSGRVPQEKVGGKAILSYGAVRFFYPDM